MRPTTCSRSTRVTSTLATRAVGTSSSRISSPHSVRLALCVDLVLNHVGVDSEIAEEHLDWLAEDQHEQDGIKRAGWHGAETFHRWEDLALLDYETFDASSGHRLSVTMLRYAMYSADFAAETGGVLRLDNLHSSHRAFVTWALSRVRGRHPNLIVLAELFTDPNSMMRLRREVGLHLISGDPMEAPISFRSYAGTRATCTIRRAACCTTSQSRPIQRRTRARIWRRALDRSTLGGERPARARPHGHRAGRGARCV